MKILRKILLGMVLPAIAGLVIGQFFSGFITSPDAAYSLPGAFLFDVLIFLPATLVTGGIIHTLAHEAGHFLGGKLSGYTPVMLHAGSLALVKIDGKLVRKKFSVSGTGGQCLMSPPEPEDDYPFALYNLSGSLANFALTAVFAAAMSFSLGYVWLMFLNFTLIGALLGLVNILPIKIKGLATDGLNALRCIRSEESRRALWIQLRYVEQSVQGVRLRDMPSNWTADPGVPTDALTGFLAALRFGYLCDTGDYDAARQYAADVLEHPGGMMPLHQSEIRGELLFFELLKGPPKEKPRKFRKRVAELHSPMLKHRLSYAYEHLHTKDTRRADAARAAFEKACLQTPFAGTVEQERELFALIGGQV